MLYWVLALISWIGGAVYGSQVAKHFPGGVREMYRFHKTLRVRGCLISFAVWTGSFVAALAVWS